MFRRVEQQKGHCAALEERPDIPPYLQRYLQAFHFLLPSRSGMGGLIPLEEIVAYLDLHQITDPAERSEWATIIREIDAAHMEGQERRRKQEQQSKDAGSKHQSSA